MSATNLPAPRSGPLERGADSVRLILLIAEGYLYLLATLSAFAGIVAFLVWGIVGRHPLVAVLAIFVGLPLLLLTGVAIRSVFFRFPEPRGVPVTRQAAPKLFAMLDEVRALVGYPRVHRMIIGERFNAGAMQIPRLAMFWPRNTLVIGYPLFVALSPDQLKAVVAHELGHFRRAHGRVSGWVYRTRVSWQRLAAVLHQRGSVPIFVYWILNGYVPRLIARSAAIARRQEFFADSCSQAAAGGRATAEALVTIAFGSRVAETQYWDAIYNGIDTQMEAPRPFAAMRGGLLSQNDRGDAGTVLASLLSDGAEWNDTHPTLQERLQAIGETGRLPPAPEVLSSDVYLGSAMDVVAAKLDGAWLAEHSETWRRRKADRKRARSRLAELADIASAAGRLESASLLEELGQEEGAMALYRAILEAEAGHPGASLALGRLLLKRGDESGADLVDRAMQRDPGLTLEACELLGRHYENRGQAADAERYYARGDRYAIRQKLDSMAEPPFAAEAKLAT